MSLGISEGNDPGCMYRVQSRTQDYKSLSVGGVAVVICNTHVSNVALHTEITMIMFEIGHNTYN